MAHKKQVSNLTPEEYADWLEQQEIVTRNGASYVIIDGHEYPLGTEPDPGLTGRDLMIAQKKEEVWMWALRLGLLGAIIMVGMIVYFALTA